MPDPQLPPVELQPLSAPQSGDGLSSAEALCRLQKFGRNVLPGAPAPSLWRRVGAQLRSPLIYILMVALVFDLGIWWIEGANQWPVEAIAIFAILALNAGLGTLQEYRSEQALAKLKSLAAPMTWVRRDGRFEHIASADIKG